MRRRHTFRAAVVETLEDRKLLSHSTNPFTKLGHNISHVFSHPHKTPAARAGHAAKAGASRAVNPTGQVTTPENSASRLNGVGLSTSKAPISYDSLLRSLSGGPASSQNGGNAAGSADSLGTPAGFNPSDPRVVYMNNADGSSTAAPGGDPNSPTTLQAPATSDAAGAAPVVTPPVQAGTVMKPMTSFGPGVSAPPLLGGVTLSPDDVSALKAAVDTFAGSYTGGQDAAQDKTAADALKTGLDDFAEGVWAETHVTTRGAVAQLQKATDDFAQTYTGGVNPAQDRGAWRSYHAALRAFSKSVTAPGGGPVHPGPGAPGPMPMMPAGGLSMIPGALLSGQGMTQDEVGKMRSAVDTFARDYTSGADAAKDQAAAKALQAGLSDLMVGRWKNTPVTATPGGPQTHFLRTIDSPSVTVPVSTPNGMG